ncbi:MAG: hypothetical protein H8E37_07785 [Planctomycetes bacterium]|nr:hypothetical protein [Planctomycetota bacterium]
MNSNRFRFLTSLSVVVASLAATAVFFVNSLNVVAQRPPERVFDVEFDELATDLKRTGSFDLAAIPARVRRFDGQRVRLRGYMCPTLLDEGITTFLLFPETKTGKWYGWHSLTPIPMHYLIRVDMKAGSTTTYEWAKPLIIEGRFRIKPMGQDGELIYIYWIEDATVTPAEPRKGYHFGLGIAC